MRISVASDHKGFQLKNYIVGSLVELGFSVIDKGCHDENPVDYPDYAKMVTDGIGVEADLGILICGTGIGMSIAANKANGIRAALAKDAKTAKLAKQHNNANVLCLAGDMDLEILDEVIKSFVCSSFEERHSERIKKVSLMEKNHGKSTSILK